MCAEFRAFEQWTFRVPRISYGPPLIWKILPRKYQSKGASTDRQSGSIPPITHAKAHTSSEKNPTDETATNPFQPYRRYGFGQWKTGAAQPF